LHTKSFLPIKTRLLAIVLVLTLLFGAFAVSAVAPPGSLCVQAYATPLTASATSSMAATATTLATNATSTTTVTTATSTTTATVYTNDTITLAYDQTEFTIPLTIEHPGSFAGVEMALQTAAGAGSVEVTSVTYRPSQSKAGPTTARGLVWFSTFSGSNVFSDVLTATVHATYRGTANTQVIIDHAAFYTTDGTSFYTLNVPLRTVVTVNRDGASNIPEPLDPPTDTNANTGAGTDATLGSGNPGPGALVNYGTDTGASTTANSIDAAAANAANRAMDANNDSGARNTTIPNTTTPLAENSITGDDATQVNNMLLGFSIVCLLAVIVLGCLLIKKRLRKDEQETTKEVF
jgi:hypothetical protein